MLFISDPSQLWKLNNGKLENKGGSWIWKDKIWNIPNEGEEGIVKEKGSGKVLEPDATFEDLTAEGKDAQKWSRSKNDLNGWFTLTNLETGKVLTAPNTSKRCNDQSSRLMADFDHKNTQKKSVIVTQTGNTCLRIYFL